MAKRTMLGIPWTAEKKKAFEDLAERFGKTQSEFAREVMDAVLECLLSREEGVQLGLLEPWQKTPPGREFLTFILDKARKPKARRKGAGG